MKISPLDIYNHEFSKTTFGYNVKQVDDFLDEVGVSYEKILKDVNNLQDENERIKEKLAAKEEMEDKLQKLMITVQETAKEITNQAHKEADIIIKKAEIKADRMKRELKEKLNEEYQALQSLKESRELFKIRYKTMLETHLEMLDNDEEPDIEVEKDIAAHGLEIEDYE